MPVYVQHEVLGKVHDVFNAENIWQAPGLALFSRRPLLRDLLERAPREFRGREATRCFSHVTLLLAQEELDDDRHLTRGARARDLAQSLTALHQKDFGDLLGADDVRYHVIGTDSLEPGEVEVKFGHAVYLPTAAERTLYEVSTSRDGEHWHSVCPIYLNQRLALLGQDADSASYAVPQWPFGPAGGILLVNDGPDADIEVQVRPKGAFECTFEDGMYTIMRRHGVDAEGGPLRMFMKVERQQSPVPTPKPAAVWKTRALAPGAQELTAVPVSHRPVTAGDATFAPVAARQVCLAALALPRLSRYRDTGARMLDIAFGSTRDVAPQGEPAALHVQVDADDRMTAVSGGQCVPLAAPGIYGQVDLREPASQMQDRYCAILRLPHAPAVPVTGGTRLTFGRSTPVLAALRVLDSPRFLRCAEGTPPASADRIGLSRSAFGFEAVADGFHITRTSPSQALYHLDADMAFVTMIEDAAIGDPYLLPFGHHLVAGHYVLRFDA